MRLKVVVPHRKERGHSNGRYHDWRSWNHPTRRSERRRTLSSEELGDEIRLLPGRQSHRHPVFDHCAFDWIGGSGVVVADTAAIGLPEQLLRHQPRGLPAIHHHSRHDHGDLSAHRIVPGGLRKLPDPADGGRPGHGFSLREHGELLGLSTRGAGPSGELLHAGRSHGLRLDPIPAPSHPLRHSGAGLGHHSDGRLPDPVHHRLHHGRIELCGDGVAGAHAGMTMMRMALTVWGIFTATILALLAFPALFVGCVMLLFDRILGTSFFMPAVVEMGEHLKYRGGSPLLFQHLFWFFGHPEVYIVAVPAFGIVSALIATHARKNIFGYRMMVWAIVAIGALSFVVWAHHMYVSGMNPYFGFFFATTTLIIAIPTAIKVYNWVLTLWRGDIHLTVPMLFALAFIVTFVNGGMTGLFLGNVVVDVP